MEAATAAKTGVDMTTIGIAIAVIVVIGLISMFMKSQGADDLKPSVELHPEQLKYMEDKDKILCTSKGKCVRCIIDYMREATEEQVQEILGETPKYTGDFVPVTFDMHDRQIDWLSSVGVKIGAGEGAERYGQLGKACRAMLDYAIRMEAENKQDTIKELFDTVRCLNC